ncbi:MAG: type II toxin-antitoxin system HipA family toxin [Candidatus Omnitrophica bacterium]|nr:type II toxin-antitoxin system HipA family toxin [Candidatus Omnitrophota bacterium]
MEHILNVFWDNDLVGRIIKKPAGLIFQYSEAWIDSKDAFPISISLPLQKPPFEETISETFFENLLPESGIKEKIARFYGVSEKNNYAMLDAIGGECAGALTVLPENESIPEEGGYEEISIDELSRIIFNPDKKPLLIGRKDIRLSLAGSQDKLPVYSKDNKFFLPRGRKASNYIIKPPIDYLQDTVANEAFCMKLAENSGLLVPSVKIIGNKVNFLLIKRYDRFETETDVKRLHQEDFCQAMGIYSNQKYEAEGGPNLVDCFSLIDKNSSQPVLDKNRLLKFVIFNYYIGNADAHAKNLSFLYDNDRIILAPFYDLISTCVYDNLSKKMAMKIGSENRLEWIRPRHFERLAKAVDINPRFTLNTLENLGKQLSIAAKTLTDKFKKDSQWKNVLGKIVKVIEKHQRLLNEQWQNGVLGRPFRTTILLFVAFLTPLQPLPASHADLFISYMATANFVGKEQDSPVIIFILFLPPLLPAM